MKAIKNFEFVKGESKTLENGVVVKRIRATNNLLAHGVKKGDLGGWLEKAENLCDGAWVADEACVFENAIVRGSARVYENARVSRNAHVYGDARVYGHASVSDNAEVFGHASVRDYAWVRDNAKVFGKSIIFGSAWLYENLQFSNKSVYARSITDSNQVRPIA